MRLLSPNIAVPALATHERLFVETWYQMSHDYSFVTYRAKCLNVRTLFRELHHELFSGRLEEQEFRSICEEAAKILDSDPIAKVRFPHHHTLAMEYLKDPPIRPTKKDENSAKRYESFTHCVADFDQELEAKYFDALGEELPVAVAAKDEDRIVSLLEAFISDLLYQGYSHSSLYAWHSKFTTNAQGYSFSQNLDFVLGKVGKSRTNYRVSLRLAGSQRPAQVVKYGKFDLSVAAPTPDNPTVEEQRFFTVNPQAVFAVCQVEATDHESAAISARSEFEILLDLMRLEYERNPVNIEATAHTCRLEDDKRFLVTMKHTLPNQVEDTKHESFMKFIEDVGKVLTSRQIESSTLEHIRAAIRLHRLGRDSLRQQDKCLYWWMGLESLANTGGGYIGQTVTHNVSRILICKYLLRLLRDLISTLKYCRIGWSPILVTASGVATLEELTPTHLVKLLQDPTGRQELWGKCSAYPIIRHYGEKLATYLTEPKKTAGFLRGHLAHLEQELSRIYRIRCSIVHGSPVVHTLTPFAANLEYYLKELILFVLETFLEHHHIHSRNELFARAGYAWERRIKALEASSNKSDVLIAVFDGVVNKKVGS